MYLTKKFISRRLALKGLGVAVGLPLLDAMIPAATALSNTAAAPKVRGGFFYIPHGAIMFNTALGPSADKWTPSGAGADFKLSHILEPLEKHKRYVASFGNLENAASAGSVHTINPATWLSCVKPDPSAAGAKMATTLDQIIASRIGQDTPLPSLEVASETTIQAAACNGAGGACYYSSTVSFRKATSPLPMEYNPRKVFIQLFGEGDTAEERAALLQQERSILDLISERTQELSGQLGASDRSILSNHLEAVREIDTDIGITYYPQPASDLAVRVSAREPLVAIVAAGHALAQKKSIGLRDVAAFPTALTTRGSRSRSLIDTACWKAGVSLSPVLETNSVEMLTGLAARSDTVTFLLRLSAEDGVRAGTLAAVPVRSEILNMGTIEVLTRVSRKLSPVSEEFLGFLRTELASGG